MKKIVPLALCILASLSCSISRGALYQDTVQANRQATQIDEEATSPGGSDDDANSNDRKGLEIISHPEAAEVYLDNRLVGVTPLLLTDLAAGRYRLTIKREGYQAQNSWIDYYQDYLRYEVELSRITGLLTVNTDPPEAQVLFDSGTPTGAYQLSAGPDPPTAGTYRLPIGIYRIRVRAFGYEDHHEVVSIQENTLTSLGITLRQAPFRMYNIRLSRRDFNPRNPGPLGRIRLSFEVSDYGTGRVTILSRRQQEVFTRELRRFETWEQDFEWNGRDASGAPLANGAYTMVIEAIPERDVQGSPAVLREEIALFIDSTIQLTYRSLWSGSSGLLYASTPEALPPASMQLSTMFLAHAEQGQEGVRVMVPWILALRVGLVDPLELDVGAGVMIGFDPDVVGSALGESDDTAAGEAAGNGVFIPYFGSIALKALLLAPGDLPGLGLAALARLSYQNASTDTLANFTGLSLGTPFALWLGRLGFLLSPELSISYRYVSYDPDERPPTGLYGWLYGRTGLILDLDPFSLGLSATLRSKPFHRGLGLDLPFQAGAELHWLLPGTQLFLSILLAGEFSAGSNFYLLSGAGLGLLD